MNLTLSLQFGPILNVNLTAEFAEILSQNIVFKFAKYKYAGRCGASLDYKDPDL